jgi:FMN phosphatase YigB (HAD superfamily)
MYIIPAGTKAISFDIWKTLLNGNKAFTRPRLRLIFGMFGIPINDIETVVAAYRASDKRYNDLMEETGTDFGFIPRMRFIFQQLCIDHPIPFGGEIMKIQSAVGELRCRPEYRPSLIEPDLPETLAALRCEGYTLGLLSNTGMDDREVMEPVLRALGIWEYFSAVVFTSDIGVAKPSRAAFAHMARVLDVPRYRVLHIGDNTNADYRANEAGMHAVVYAPNGIEGYPFISSMRELAPVLVRC